MNPERKIVSERHRVMSEAPPSFFTPSPTMVTRFIAAAGIAANLIAQSAFAQGDTFAPNPFTDVPENHINYQAIEFLRQNNVLKGYTDGTFKPDARINRAEFVKLIANPFILDTERLNECLNQELDEDDQTVFFPDVRRDSWYAPELCLAKVLKLVDGYPDGTFKPGEYINFVEAAKIIVGTFALQTSEEPTGEFWYRKYVNVLSERNAIPTSVARFDEPVTRGEMAEMLFRLKTHNTVKPSRNASDLR